ncbi:MAG TPA: futalosine hydrolase [Micromonosporaceae bacterium]|nr:futalosine hydrolase [Micromonosporaceae bacterium]
MTFLVVTAVAAERDAVLGGLGGLGGLAELVEESRGPRPEQPPVRILVGGIGAAAAAARTAHEMAAFAFATGHAYEAVLNFGIGGGYAGRAAVGDTVIGARTVAADLGAESPAGFLTMADLGFGTDTIHADERLVAAMTDLMPAAIVGAVLTLQNVTGTAARATDLAERHPDAVAEAMEGFGVATAAALHGIAFMEVRTVSNLVGPRDRSAWRIGPAMAALTTAARALATLVG